MKPRNFILLLVLVMYLPGCIGDDCNPCFTPPEPFLFAIVDKASGENLFSNGTYTPAEIKIVDLATNSQRPFTFISENNLDLIQVTSIGWQTEKVTIDLSITKNSLFSMFVDAERITGECCSYTTYHEIRIDKAPYEFDSTSGIYTVFID